MRQHPLLGPILFMVLLTAITWVRLYQERIGEMKTRRISPQKVANRRAAAELLQNTRAVDHLANLFEMPVLFYLLAICLMLCQLESNLQLALAWLFVLLRGVHTTIHLSYNRVLHRFYAYLASGLVLFTSWLLFAIQLLLQ